jgi:LacI family transcriptional regulator
MRYLLEKGRRRLAFLSSPPSLPTHIHLLRGIRQELSDAGVELLPEHMGLTGYDQSRAFAILDSWLARRSHRPSAVFTADDSLLLQMYDYVESRQLSVPGDISIVARANSPNAGGLRPVPRRFTFPTDPLQPIGAAFGPLGFLGEAVGYQDPTR